MSYFVRFSLAFTLIFSIFCSGAMACQEDKVCHDPNCPTRAEVSQRIVTLALKNLKSPSPRARKSAVKTLADFANLDSTVHQQVSDGLVMALSDLGSSVRYRAAKALGQMNPSSLTVATALNERLIEEKDDCAAFYMIWALGKLRTPDASIHRSLVRKLNGRDHILRKGAAEALIEIYQSQQVKDLVSNAMSYDRSGEYGIPTSRQIEQILTVITEYEMAANMLANAMMAALSHIAANK